MRETDYYFFSKTWKDNCKDGFVYGSLIVSGNKYYICVATLCALNCYVNNGNTSMIEVIPETVGRCTGYKDKNGVLIFEGDILKGFEYPFYNKEQNEFNYFAEIVWFENSPAFGYLVHKNPLSKVNGISSGNAEYLENFQSSSWEIIGDIYNNSYFIGE